MDELLKRIGKIQHQLHRPIYADSDVGKLNTVVGDLIGIVRDLIREIKEKGNAG